MKLPFVELMKDEGGATAIEYALLATLISITIIATLQVVAGSLNNVFSEVSSALK
jgi:pilus assembly protein Flp/PilA